MAHRYGSLEWCGVVAVGLFLGTVADARADDVALSAAYTGEVVGVLRGGIQRGTVVQQDVGLICDADLESALGWKGGTLSLYGLGDHGQDPSELVGDVQALSNISAANTWKLYEAWLDQELADGVFSARAGLYDLNSEFDAMDTAGLFVNSSHGIGPDYSQSGENGPSIFPTTSLGVRLATASGRGLYARTVALDGVAGDPADDQGTHVLLDPEDGLLLAAEVGRQGELDGPRRRVGLGGWGYTAPVDGTDRVDRNWGVYALTEQQVLGPASDAGLVVFGRVGLANPRVNQVGSYLGLGAVYTGLLPGRGGDKLGIAVAQARNSGAFLADHPALDASETALELSYAAELSAWLLLHPDLQYIVNPGMDPQVDDALAVMVRIEAGFDSGD